MKRILYVFALLAVLLVVSTPAHATRATTTNRCIACMSEQLLDDMTQFIAAKDKDSVGAYWHGYRIGPRSGPQGFRYHWLPPILVKESEPPENE